MKVRSLLYSLLLPLLSSAHTLRVGTDQPLHSLQAAVQQAANGDTIVLLPGIYREGRITITKSITLLGIGLPVLDGNHRDELLLVSGHDIHITGIHFRYSGYSAMNDYASVKLVDCERVWVENNLVEEAYFGIHVSNSRLVFIRGNRIFGKPTSEQLAGNGIHLWKSANALVENNEITGHRDGIYFEFVTASLINKNNSHGNIRYGLHFMFSNHDLYTSNSFRDNGAGVAVMYSSGVTMMSNRFEHNWGPSSYGLLLKDISDSHIAINHFEQNTVGIHMEGSSRIAINCNQFDRNGWALKVQASCEQNSFIANNFTGNSFDAGTNGSLSLNEFNHNYWDKYEGYDLQRDGIGDIPYHPVSLYAMITEQNPQTLILMRSFMVQLLDKAERVVPSVTPENLSDNQPSMKQIRL